MWFTKKCHLKDFTKTWGHNYRNSLVINNRVFSRLNLTRICTIMEKFLTQVDLESNATKYNRIDYFEYALCKVLIYSGNGIDNIIYN